MASGNFMLNLKLPLTWNMKIKVLRQKLTWEVGGWSMEYDINFSLGLNDPAYHPSCCKSTAKGLSTPLPKNWWEMYYPTYMHAMPRNRIWFCDWHLSNSPKATKITLRHALIA